MTQLSSKLFEIPLRVIFNHTFIGAVSSQFMASTAIRRKHGPTTKVEYFGFETCYQLRYRVRVSSPTDMTQGHMLGARYHNRPFMRLRKDWSVTLSGRGR